MKNVFKKGLSLLLSITIILSSAYVGLGEVDFSGLFAVKAEAASVDDLTFRLSGDGTYYRVSDCSNSVSGEIIIPSTYDGKPVTSIGNYAFEECTSLTSITIPDSVTSIGRCAFYECTSLTSITIPDSVTSIGEYTFYDCTSLTSVTIPDSVTSIGDDAFRYCTSLTSITIPDSVTSIGNGAFYYCTNLTSVTIPDSVTSIGNSAFEDCDSLTAVYITDITNWCNIDFYYCNSNPLYYANNLYLNGELVTNLIIPEGVTSIGDSAFFGCESLTSVTIPNSVTSIDEEAFCGCESLTSVTIPNSVTSIGSYAFEGCTSLTSITIPDSVTSIGDSAFSVCKSLTSVTIPNSVTSIGERAFESCISLTSITIPDGVTSISSYTFYGCDSLTSVTIPDSVTSIGNSAFSGCDNLISVTIPDSVTSIGSSAFSSCTSLTSVTIGDSVTCIDYYAFYNCTGLTSITIPDSVTSIGYGAFYYCKSLTSVTIPDSVTNIGDYAFWGCDSLTSVTIPNSVTSIGDSAFEDCRSLTSVTIPDGVTSIGEYAFAYCGSLTSVTIGDSVTRIGNSAFEDCFSLSYIFYNSTQDKWESIKIGSNNSNLTNTKIHYESTDHTASDWIIVDATVNSAGKKYKECTQCGLTLETETIPQLKCSKAKLTSTSNTTKGVKITWGKVEGADSYIVYRKTKGGSWKYLDSRRKTYFTDSTAKTGTTYYYAVKVRNEAGDTDYSNSLSIKRLSNPKLSKVSNTSSGVEFTWKKVTGASGYIVYRKTKGNDWKEIGKTTKLSFTDKNAKSGTSYYYTVRAYSGSVKSYYNTDGLTIRRLVAPKISSATSKSEGILIKWNKITGASGYYVYRKASSGEWKKIENVKGNNKIKYLDESPRKGATYQYRVKAYYSKSTSYNSNIYKIKCNY